MTSKKCKNKWGKHLDQWNMNLWDDNGESKDMSSRSFDGINHIDMYGVVARLCWGVVSHETISYNHNQ